MNIFPKGRYGLILHQQNLLKAQSINQSSNKPWYYQLEEVFSKNEDVQLLFRWAIDVRCCYQTSALLITIRGFIWSKVQCETCQRDTVECKQGWTIV